MPVNISKAFRNLAETMEPLIDVQQISIRGLIVTGTVLPDMSQGQTGQEKRSLTI